jgi:hypothetical protein
MITKIVEVTNGELNWGKFMVGVFDASDHQHPSVVSPEQPLLRQIGHSPNGYEVWVLDLQTCEGALFRIGGLAKADLDKHKVWVCPMFEPFLEWLYRNWQGLDALPAHVDLPDAPFAMSGYRRAGE